MAHAPGLPLPRISYTNASGSAGAIFIQIGVAVTARLDPLVPDVTDAEENLVPLLDSLQQAGITRLSASYLFLRPSFARGVSQHITRLHGARSGSSSWERMAFLGEFGSGWAMDVPERAARFRRLEALAARHAITLAVCRCKNPEFSGSGCGISGPPAGPPLASRQQEHNFS